MTNIDLTQLAVTTREDRLGSITGFNGSASELVKCAHAGKLKDTSRTFTQCMGCNARNAFCQLAMIKDAAIVNPNAIFVTTSCASGIIGEDVGQVTDDLTEELGIPVVACACEGFRSKIWTTGFDAAYHAILRKIVKPPRKKTNKINVANFWEVAIFLRNI